MDKQEPSFDSAASSAEAKAEPAAESKTESKSESKTIEAEAVSSERAGGDDKDRSFPLAIYAPTPAYRRYGLMAATVVIALALGGLIGSAGTYSFTTPKADPAEPARHLQAALKQVTKDVAALKTSIEAANRATASQTSKLGERFASLERAQAEPAAKIAGLTETVSRLEKRIAAKADTADITGSIAGNNATTTAAKDQSKPQIVEGWVLRDIYRGRALVESKTGLYEITPGADLPGIGKVQTITQQNGRWVVVTPKGLIVSMR